MIITTGKETLERLITRQLENNFLLDNPEEHRTLLETLDGILPALERCFQMSSSWYYHGEGGEALFDPYHTCQYGIFLYFLSRSLAQRGNARQLAAKVYALNKMLNGCDLYYEVQLPEVFTFDHPVGAVMGRANYGNFFRFSQGSCVGNSRGLYPTLGERVTLYPFARVIGNCRVGSNVFVSHGAYVKDIDIPDNSLVFGTSPNLTIKSRPPEYFLERCGFNC